MSNLHFITIDGKNTYKGKLSDQPKGIRHFEDKNYCYFRWHHYSKSDVHYCPDEKQVVFFVDDGMNSGIEFTEDDLVLALALLREEKERLDDTTK